jgi:hypothetical protein
MENIFITPPLELFGHFLVVIGAIVAFYFVVSTSIATVVLLVGGIALLILRMIVLFIRGILRFIFPWAFSSPKLDKESVGFHPYPKKGKRYGFLSNLRPIRS